MVEPLAEAGKSEVIEMQTAGQAFTDTLYVICETAWMSVELKKKLLQLADEMKGVFYAENV